MLELRTIATGIIRALGGAISLQSHVVLIQQFARLDIENRRFRRIHISCRDFPYVAVVKRNGANDVISGRSRNRITVATGAEERNR